jgi:hypothetical protein
MAFDIEGAKAAGYSAGEIADFLGAENKFDTTAARNAGYSDDELIQHLSGGQPSAEETDAQIAARARGELVPEDEGYFAGLGQAAAGASKSTAGGIMQLAGSEESGRELTLAGRAQGKNYPSISDLPALYRQEGLWESVKAAPRAISYDVARTAPVIATGVAAGALAPEVALGGIGAATLAELGVYGLSATGENINRQADQIAAGTRTEFDRGAAIASGLAQGVLDKVGINQILGRAGAIGERVAKTLGTKTAAEEVLQASTRTGLGTAGRVVGSTIGTGVIEGGVEAGQEALSRAQAGESLTDREALEAYGTSALGGVLVGGTMRAPFATVEGMSSKDRALSKIEYFGNVGLDVLTDKTALTPEFFKENGRLMAEGIARNTEGSENAKTNDEAFAELKAKVKTQEQFDAELAKMQEEAARDKESKPLTEEEEFFKQRAEAKAAEAQAAELPAGRPDILYGQQEGVPLTPEQQAKRVAEYNEKRKKKEEKAAAAGYKKFSQEDMFGGYEGPQQRQEITPEEIEAEGINKRQEDIFGYKPLDKKVPKGTAPSITPELRSTALPVSVEGDVLTPEQAATYAEAIPFREAAQEKQQAVLDEQAKIQAEKQKALIEKNEADTAKKVAKLKPGETLDIFGGKKGTIKEEVIPEPKAVEEVSPLKQVDVVDEAKRLEVPNLVTALKGLTKTAEGGPHPDTLLGKEPVGQRKATDFATAVHAEVGAKDTDVITPDHVAKANIKDLEVGKLVERAGGLPISDPKVSAAINKLTPEKQKALIDVLSKEYTPENYIKPSEMLVSKADVLNLGLRPQSGLVKELFTSPKVEAINVINDPKGAKKLIGALKKVAEVNKNTPTAVKAKELYENIDRTLAKVKVANNKAVAAKAKTQDSYSVAPTGATTGHTTASLSKALSPELKRLVASGKAVLHDTADTLPGTGHPANVKGMTTAEGVTHYVANKLTPSTIESVALHEVGVHAGMAKMLGAKLWSYVKDQAMTNQGDAFVKARAAVPKGTPDHLVAEEALAYLVENSPNLSLVRQIVASIRNFLRAKLGANIRLSEADARQMAVDAMRREAKTAERTAREETAFSVGKDGFDENVPKIRKKANAIASFNREKLPSYLELFSAAGIREIGAKYLRGRPSEDGTPSKNSASEILKDTRKITGMTNKLLEEYLDLRKQINKYIKENRRQVGILGDTANLATILQVSPSEINPDSPNNIDNRIESELANQEKGYAQRVKDLKALKVRWGQLTPQSKLMYNKLADFYKKSYQDYINAELSRIDTAEISDEKKERQREIFTKKMKHTQLKGDYFPVMRFGNYAVQYTDGDIDEDTGELIPKFSKFESEEEAREFIDNNPSIETKGVTKDILRDNSSILTGNRSLDALWKSVDKKFEKIESTEDIAIVADEMKDYLFQMHLMGRPEQSIAKRFLHRKGTAGYSNDIFRSFDTYALSMSKQLPRIELSNNIMAKLDNLSHELPVDETLAVDYYNAFKKQITDSVYPKQLNGAINTITGAVFHYYLSAPASAALQLASIPLQGAPSIAKVHGVNAARRALNSAVGLYTSSMTKKTPFGDIKRGAEARKDTIGNLVTGAKHADEFNLPDAMDKMRAEGLLLPSVHAQAFSGQNKPTSKSDSAFAKAKRVMEITSRPFAEAESAARQVSAAAAYIANMRSGMTHQDAIRSAIDTTYLDLGDFGATGQSSLVKTGFGGMVKVASQFQQYGAKLLFAFGKAGYDALKGESPEVRRQGIKFLGSLYAMHWLFAGALGLPGAGLAMSITDFIRDIAGDDDERHSLEQDMRNAMRSSGLNNTVVKMILDGPIGTITNMNLTPRIGAGDLIPMIQESDLNETLKGDVVGDFGKTMLGAAGSTAANIMKASEAWTAGNYEQAIEKIMPAGIRNVMTAHRYATEGKLTPKGLPIVSKEEISTWDVVARALGMETMHMAEKSKAARSAHMLDKFIDDRKEFLYDEYAKASPKEQEKVMAALVKFAERHPGAGVSAKSILSSLKGKERAKYTNTRGQMLGKNVYEIESEIPELEADEEELD